MKIKKWMGIILFVLGYAAFAFQAIICITRQLPSDPRMATEKTRTIPLPPILGGVALSGGIVLLIRNDRKSGVMRKWNCRKKKRWLDTEDL
ncbi:MAG TPA: hypothetical protein VHP14_21870 [Anaerolineales bacterium]|nr:hypothetical protein [Anaerolineales bacterium]